MIFVMIYSIKNKTYSNLPAVLLLIIIMTVFGTKGYSQAESAREEDYFKIMRVPARKE